MNWEKFRDPELSKKILKRVQELGEKLLLARGKKAMLMEVCGTHTVAISRAGLRSLLRDFLELRSGPGCPVCVTDQRDIDAMIALAHTPGVVVGTFGDMVRVPGSFSSLEKERAKGAAVEIFYSPQEAVSFAACHPEKEVVFLGVGFETTAPAVAASITEAQVQNLKNFRIFSAHKLIPPVMHVLLRDPALKVDGFLLPGHVSTIIGRQAFDFIARDYHVPAVVTGFELVDILGGIYLLLRQLLAREAVVENGYTRVVREEGNKEAQNLLRTYFEPGDAAWRGFGVVPESGLTLKRTYAAYDACQKFPTELPPSTVPKGCACGDLLKGKLSPPDCPLFARACTPLRPVGPCMVSSEGACAAYYQFEQYALREEKSL